MNVLELFAGIGGIGLGLERAGMTVVGQVEIDPFCRAVLDKHWPGVPKHDDVRTAVEWWRSEPRPPVHLAAGGFPCQPVSTAGRGLAQDDARWLWDPMRDIIDAIRPDWVIAENVPGLRKRGLALVLRDLRRLGYAVRAGYINACEVGAPHSRARLFILAHTDGVGRHQLDRSRSDQSRSTNGTQPTAYPRGSWWATEPRVVRVAYGIPGGVDRRRALGNAVVPQVAEHIGRLILDAERTAA